MESQPGGVAVSSVTGWYNDHADVRKPHRDCKDDSTVRTDKQALAGVPEEERCHCDHVPVEGNPRMFEVKKADGSEQPSAA